jgi:hypothetical protein
MCTSTQIAIPQSDGSELMINDLILCDDPTCPTSGIDDQDGE